MIARDAGRAPAPTPPPPPAGSSFLRRHPILAGFGVLAALSLFAAYWPVSAMVTGVIVAARATGADQVALGVLGRGAARVLDRVKRWSGLGRSPESAPGPDGPAQDAPPTATEPPMPAQGPPPVAVTAPPAPPGEAPPAPRPRRPRPAPRRRIDPVTARRGVSSATAPGIDLER